MYSVFVRRTVAAATHPVGDIPLKFVFINIILKSFPKFPSTSPQRVKVLLQAWAIGRINKNKKLNDSNILINLLSNCHCLMWIRNTVFTKYVLWLCRDFLKQNTIAYFRTWIANVCDFINRFQFYIQDMRLNVRTRSNKNRLDWQSLEM